MGQAIAVRTGLYGRRGSPVCPASERCCAGATAVSDCGRARRRLAGRGGALAMTMGGVWHAKHKPYGLAFGSDLVMDEPPSRRELAALYRASDRFAAETD